MALKNFKTYLEKRLNPAEIEEIEKQAKLEVISLHDLQKNVANAIEEYMLNQGIGFNELVRRLDFSPSQVAKIQRGEANLTLTSIAHISALIGKYPLLKFQAKLAS